MSHGKGSGWRHVVRGLVAALLLVGAFPSFGQAQSGDQQDPTAEERLQALEKQVTELQAQLAATPAGAGDSSADESGDVQSQVDEIMLFDALDADSWLNRFTLGGYGESHFNFQEGDDGDLADLHRLVTFLGYQFTDWIHLDLEVEIEHAFVDSDDGELTVEQAYVEFHLLDQLNVRVGRILTPVGIVNVKHEPPSFNGVERPNVETNVIPSTWFGDGIGFTGSIAPQVKYEVYIVSGLDGSQFSAGSGIRGGRLKERPSLRQPAVTGRFDFFPFAESPLPGQFLRLGLSGYGGRVANGDQGNNPDNTRGSVQMYAADFEYTIGILDLRGVAAWARIDDTEELGAATQVGTEILGWYLEAAVHVLPDSARTGLLESADLVLFVRYDDVNTHFRVRHNEQRDRTVNRSEVTAGFTFFFAPNLALKADYQVRADKTSSKLDDLFNVGLGWEL